MHFTPCLQYAIHSLQSTVCIHTDQIRSKGEFELFPTVLLFDQYISLLAHLWIIIELKKSWAIAESQPFGLVFKTYHSKDMESKLKQIDRTWHQSLLPIYSNSLLINGGYKLNKNHCIGMEKWKEIQKHKLTHSLRWFYFRDDPYSSVSSIQY